MAITTPEAVDAPQRPAAPHADLGKALGLKLLAAWLGDDGDKTPHWLTLPAGLHPLQLLMPAIEAGFGQVYSRGTARHERGVLAIVFPDTVQLALADALFAGRPWWLAWEGSRDAAGVMDSLKQHTHRVLGLTASRQAPGFWTQLQGLPLSGCIWLHPDWGHDLESLRTLAQHQIPLLLVDGLSAERHRRQVRETLGTRPLSPYQEQVIWPALRDDTRIRLLPAMHRGQAGLQASQLMAPDQHWLLAGRLPPSWQAKTPFETLNPNLWTALGQIARWQSREGGVLQIPDTRLVVPLLPWLVSEASPLRIWWQEPPTLLWPLVQALAPMTPFQNPAGGTRIVLSAAPKVTPGTTQEMATWLKATDCRRQSLLDLAAPADMPPVGPCGACDRCC